MAHPAGLSYFRRQKTSSENRYHVLVCRAVRILKYILYILEGGRKHAHFSADLSRGR